jgi:hypothetical protein
MNADACERRVIDTQGTVAWVLAEKRSAIILLA